MQMNVITQKILYIPADLLWSFTWNSKLDIKNPSILTAHSSHWDLTEVLKNHQNHRNCLISVTPPVSLCLLPCVSLSVLMQPSCRPPAQQSKRCRPEQKVFKCTTTYFYTKTKGSILEVYFFIYFIYLRMV